MTKHDLHIPSSMPLFKYTILVLQNLQSVISHICFSFSYDKRLNLNINYNGSTERCGAL